jgi:hypothetical protein
VSRAYTGIDGADNTIPGIVIIRRDGTIAYRKISEEKDDRLDAAGLLAIADRTLGSSGKSARTGYAALARLQLGIESDLSIGGNATSYGVRARFAFPSTRVGFAGIHVGYSTTGRVDTAGFAGLRVPLFGDTAAIQATVLGGLHDTTGYGGGRLGLWLAWTPAWAVQLDVGATAEIGSSEPALTFTFGVSRLISWR